MSRQLPAIRVNWEMLQMGDCCEFYVYSKLCQRQGIRMNIKHNPYLIYYFIHAVSSLFWQFFTLSHPYHSCPSIILTDQWQDVISYLFCCIWIDVNLSFPLLLNLSLDVLLLVIRCEVHCPWEGCVRHTPRVRLSQHGLSHTRQTKLDTSWTFTLENLDLKLTVNC